MTFCRWISRLTGGGKPDRRQREQIERSAEHVMERLTENLDREVSANTEKTDVFTRLVADLRRKERILA